VAALLALVRATGIERLAGKGLACQYAKSVARKENKMEFHNVKLLPKGLPEIIAQLVPYDIYLNTKVIAYPRKLTGGVAGIAGCDGMTRSYHIGLYPTILSFYAGNGGIGTYSFNLWFHYLKTALHEIGHLATRALIQDIPGGIDKFGTRVGSTRDHMYVEGLANDWMCQALARILQVSPRLGQPLGALTGYPGMNAYRLRNWGKPWNNGEHNYYRQTEWRGLSCGGQVTINDIAKKLMYQEHPGYELPPEGWEKARAKFSRAVHKAAKELGIERYFVNKNGRRYLMFNAGEAEAVYEWVVGNRIEQIRVPDCLKPPEMQCVNCWHRWKPEQHFRDTPRCPDCGSFWLITVEAIKMGLRKEHEHKLPW